MTMQRDVPGSPEAAYFQRHRTRALHIQAETGLPIGEANALATEQLTAEDRAAEHARTHGQDPR